jgi:hypothetical protein
MNEMIVKHEVLPLKGAAPSYGLSIKADDPAFDDRPVARTGREALAKENEVQGEVRRSRERTYQIGEALVAGREWAMDQAHTNNPRTRRCREFFGHWLQVNGFADIDGSPCNKDKKGSGEFGCYLRLAQKPVRDVVDAYLDTLTEKKRATYNSPSALWRAYACKDRCNRGRLKGEVAPEMPPGVDTSDPQSEAEARALKLAHQVQRECALIDPKAVLTKGTRVNLIEAADLLLLLAKAKAEAA